MVNRDDQWWLMVIHKSEICLVENEIAGSVLKIAEISQPIKRCHFVKTKRASQTMKKRLWQASKAKMVMNVEFPSGVTWLDTLKKWEWEWCSTTDKMALINPWISALNGDIIDECRKSDDPCWSSLRGPSRPSSRLVEDRFFGASWALAVLFSEVVMEK